MMILLPIAYPQQYQIQCLIIFAMFDNCRIDEASPSDNILNLSMMQAKDSILANLQAKSTDKIEFAWMNLNKFTFIGMFYFQRAVWTSLKELHLMQNSVGDLGCKFISRAKMESLTLISLKDNRIGSSGIFHISKANWPQLHKLDASDNVIGIGSLKWLSKSCFYEIEQMKFSSRNSLINNTEIVELVLAKFPNLKRFNSYNRSHNEEKWILYYFLESKYHLKMIKL